MYTTGENWNRKGECDNIEPPLYTTGENSNRKGEYNYNIEPRLYTASENWNRKGEYNYDTEPPLYTTKKQKQNKNWNRKGESDSRLSFPLGWTQCIVIVRTYLLRIRTQSCWNTAITVFTFLKAKQTNCYHFHDASVPIGRDACDANAVANCKHWFTTPFLWRKMLKEWRFWGVVKSYLLTSYVPSTAQGRPRTNAAAYLAWMIAAMSNRIQIPLLKIYKKKKNEEEAWNE